MSRQPQRDECGTKSRCSTVDSANRPALLRPMVISRMRRCAWLLILVFVTGLGAPVLASVAPSGPVPVSVTHQHTHGVAHSHIGASIPGVAAVSAVRSGIKPPHCTDCLTGAACAISCLGVAILSGAMSWTAPVSAAIWVPGSPPVWSGFTPAGESDPPRAVRHS